MQQILGPWHKISWSHNFLNPWFKFEPHSQRLSPEDTVKEPLDTSGSIKNHQNHFSLKIWLVLHTGLLNNAMLSLAGMCLLYQCVKCINIWKCRGLFILFSNLWNQSHVYKIIIPSVAVSKNNSRIWRTEQWGTISVIASGQRQDLLSICE